MSFRPFGIFRLGPPFDTLLAPEKDYVIKYATCSNGKSYAIDIVVARQKKIAGEVFLRQPNYARGVQVLAPQETTVLYCFSRCAMQIDCSIEHILTFDHKNKPTKQRQKALIILHFVWDERILQFDCLLYHQPKERILFLLLKCSH